ncbi:MAG: RluA family pseudouridine synthase, partial [Firmicutes bacterium]|nr:RluA family pseudouridine synthase [Bacillota bacterium]
MEKLSFIVSAEEAGSQAKKLIRSKFRLSSRMMTKIKYGDLISVNGENQPGYFVLSEGDNVIVSIPDEKSQFTPEDIPISPLYEDDDFLIINKQAGITVHPTKGHPDHTMANGIMKYMIDTNQSFKVRFVNRLDMDTSGVLVVAKNSMVQADLNRQMMDGRTTKEYLAIVSGNVAEDHFTIDLPIGDPEPGS